MKNVSLGEFYREIIANLTRGEVETPKFEAEILLKHFAGVTKSEILCDFDKILTKNQQKNVQKAIKKRLKNVPIQYILGEWEFYSLRLKVQKGVLIPRAETELLVDLACEIVQKHEKNVQKANTLKILDLCCGSGCIGISIAKNCTTTRVYCADYYKTPLKITRENAKLNDVKIQIIKENALKLPKIDEKFDIICCNPPYIGQGEKQDLDKHVLKEPHEALFGGKNPLTFYESIAKNWQKSLNKNGCLLFEVGINQAEKVAEILENNGFENVEIVRDLNGIERVVKSTYCGKKC